LDDEEGQVYKLVHKYKVALPLRPDYGTQPNVYYVPPVFSPDKYDADGAPIDEGRIPDAELEKLFGGAVHHAKKTILAEREKRRQTGESELMDILIAYQHQDMFRLDNNYYQQVAHEQGRKALAPVDERYVKGKHTKFATHYKVGGHH
jgi:complex iron-sulfur molybdoenzyme family reductase subunit beta